MKFSPSRRMLHWESQSMTNCRVSLYVWLLHSLHAISSHWQLALPFLHTNIKLHTLVRSTTNAHTHCTVRLSVSSILALAYALCVTCSYLYSLLPGIIAPRDKCSWELSLPGAKVPSWNFRSEERKYQRAKSRWTKSPIYRLANW